MSAELLTILLNFQPHSPELQRKREYDEAVRSFVANCANISAQHFQKGADTPQDVLLVLNPYTNSIAYAFALRHRIAAIAERKTVPDNLKPGGALWNRLVQFLETFDPVQMRYAGQEWRKLIEFLEQIARAIGTPALAISPIRSAMIRLDPTTGTFTTVHLSFMQLCMETRSYAAAKPIIDNYIHSLPFKIPTVARDNLEYSVMCADTVGSGEYINTQSGHSDKIAITDVQEYYLLGAMAYLGLRQFEKALHFLEHVLVVPANNVANGLMLEAYKKWVLVNCLINGSAKSTPRTANGQAIKHVKSASKAYEALAEAFAQLNNLPKLKAQITAGKDIWAEDGNTGLVHELLDSQYKLYVSRLSQTFSAIPVSNISNSVGGSVEDITAYLETLIKDGHLNARLEHSNKADIGVVLRFFLDPTQGPLAKSEMQQQQALLQQTERTNRLAQQVKDADYRLSLTKEYLENLKRQNKKAAAGGGGDAMDVTWDDGVDAEEDIMGDLH